MREKVIQIIIKEILDLGVELPDSVAGGMDEETRLFGRSGVLDSIGLVSLMVAVEQVVEDEFGQPIIIASERAMSQNKSPFRTIGTLSDWVVQLVEEARANG